MVEKMTAVWLIILTILVCAAVPGALILLTTSAAPAKAPAKMVTWFALLDNSPIPDQFQ
jgi:hypothetical protein